MLFPHSITTALFYISTACYHHLPYLQHCVILISMAVSCFPHIAVLLVYTTVLFFQMRKTTGCRLRLLRTTWTVPPTPVTWMRVTRDRCKGRPASLTWPRTAKAAHLQTTKTALAIAGESQCNGLLAKKKKKSGEDFCLSVCVAIIPPQGVINLTWRLWVCFYVLWIRFDESNFQNCRPECF